MLRFYLELLEPILPWRSPDWVWCCRRDGEPFRGCEPGLTIAAVSGFAEVHLELDVSGAERKGKVLELEKIVISTFC